MSNLILDETKSQQQSTDVNLSKNFLWRLLQKQQDLSFFQSQKPAGVKPSKSPAKTQARTSAIINDGNNRGYCPEYNDRKLISTEIRTVPNPSYQAVLDKYGPSLVIVASQEQRSCALCPSHKCLDYENLNDIEYCVLEAIARSRYSGMYTSGDDGLSKKFNLTAKQLHYTFTILEGHGLIKKQVLKSERQRSIVYLMRYAFKNKTLAENVCDYLMQKGVETDYADSFVSIKRKFSFSNKQFKTLVQNGERAGIFKRFTLPVTVQVSKRFKNLGIKILFWNKKFLY